MEISSFQTVRIKETEKISEGNMPEEEAAAARRELDELAKPHNVRMMLDTYDKIVFGLANNPLSSIAQEKRALVPTVLLFGNDGRLVSELSKEKRALDYELDTVRLVELVNRDNDYHFYDEFQAKIDMKKLNESEIGTVLFCVELGDFNGLQGLLNEIPYALARCYDPYTLQNLDSHEIMSKLRIDELNGLIQATQEPVGGGGVNEAEAAIPNKVMLVCFAIRKNLEMKQEKKGQLDNGTKTRISLARIPKGESKQEVGGDTKGSEVSKADKSNSSQWRYEGVKAITFYKEGAREKTVQKIEELIRDEVRKAKEVAEKQKEEEARVREEIERKKQEEERERKRQEEKAREKPMRGRRNEPQAQRETEQSKEEAKEENDKSMHSGLPSERKGLDGRNTEGNDLDSRCIGTIVVPLDTPIEELKLIIEGKVIDQFPDLWEATKYGWELMLEGKPLNRSSKIKRATHVTDLQWVCCARPPTPPPPPEEKGEDEEGSQGDGSHNQSYEE